ncbi:hypothetical protein PR048_013002 [Dryococelus australis]|uniref:Uncharacterized protein n=1 Tax=Dryococelus australis TaxID=614101 RepID=A0ABQ9HR88_9NEOP|nr:hypothetical protein PR048_013002 [Dryococelus australis]
MKGWGKWEVPEKTCRPASLSGIIPLLGDDRLTAQSPRAPLMKRALSEMFRTKAGMSRSPASRCLAQSFVRQLLAKQLCMCLMTEASYRDLHPHTALMTFWLSHRGAMIPPCSFEDSIVKFSHYFWKLLFGKNDFGAKSSIYKMIRGKTGHFVYNMAAPGRGVQRPPVMSTKLAGDFSLRLLKSVPESPYCKTFSGNLHKLAYETAKKLTLALLNLEPRQKINGLAICDSYLAKCGELRSGNRGGLKKRAGGRRGCESERLQLMSVCAVAMGECARKLRKNNYPTIGCSRNVHFVVNSLKWSVPVYGSTRVVPELSGQTMETTKLKSRCGHHKRQMKSVSVKPKYFTKKKVKNKKEKHEEIAFDFQIDLPVPNLTVEQEVIALRKELLRVSHSSRRRYSRPVAEEELRFTTTESMNVGSEENAEVAAHSNVAGISRQFCSVGTPQPGVGKSIALSPPLTKGRYLGANTSTSSRSSSPQLGSACSLAHFSYFRFFSIARKSIPLASGKDCGIMHSASSALSSSPVDTQMMSSLHSLSLESGGRVILVFIFSWGAKLRLPSTTCGNLRQNCDYLRLPATTSDYPLLPATTCDNLRLRVTTCDNLRKPVTTRNYLRLLVTTCDYLRLLAITCDYLRENGAAPESKVGGKVDPRQNPPTSDTVLHDSHLQKSGSDPAGDLIRQPFLIGSQDLDVQSRPNLFIRQARQPCRSTCRNRRDLLGVGAAARACGNDSDTGGCNPPRDLEWDGPPWDPILQDQEARERYGRN